MQFLGGLIAGTALFGIVIGGGIGVAYTLDQDTTMSRPLAEAQLWNPASGQWTAIRGIHTPRNQHFALAVGRSQVLWLGGEDYRGEPVLSLELCDETGFKEVGHVELNLARARFARGQGHGVALAANDDGWQQWDLARGWRAVNIPIKGSPGAGELLPDGRLLLVGGPVPLPGEREAGVWSPAIGRWAPVSPPGVGDGPLLSVALTDQSVVLVTEVDPPIGWSGAKRWVEATGWSDAPHLAARLFAEGCRPAQLLPLSEGRALLFERCPAPRLFVWRAADDSVTEAGAPAGLGQAPQFAALPDGRVLAVGGSCSVWDGSWTPTGCFPPHEKLTLTALEDGHVLASGGEELIKDPPPMTRFIPFAVLLALGLGVITRRGVPRRTRLGFFCGLPVVLVGVGLVLLFFSAIRIPG